MRKKHYLQMTPEEFDTLECRLLCINHYLTISDHAIKRLNLKNIYVDLEEIAEIIDLDYYKIIEFKRESNGEEKVVIRFSRQYKNDLCVVISLTYNRIVTVWENSINDNHKTVNLDVYDKNLEIL